MVHCNECVCDVVCSHYKDNRQECAFFMKDKDTVEVVRCKDCKHWHEETGWCTEHSHFVGFDGMACHPSQSSEWKMFDAEDFCSRGERKDDGNG